MNAKTRRLSQHYCDKFNLPKARFEHCETKSDVRAVFLNKDVVLKVFLFHK